MGKQLQMYICVVTMKSIFEYINVFLGLYIISRAIVITSFYPQFDRRRAALDSDSD